MFYQGYNPSADAYKSVFEALGPVFTAATRDIEYKYIYNISGLGISSSVCRKNKNLAGFPNSFTKWDPRAMLAGFRIFSEFSALDKYNTSAWIFESYGRGHVKAVPASENAVAPEERFLHLLTSPLFWWSGEDEEDRATAFSYGYRIQKVIRGDSAAPPHAYVNYAIGHEPLPEVYGRDVARVARLERMKAAYDPDNRFGFYMPIL